MSSTEPLLLGGAPGSPYTRKMLAALRYRRIPYRFMLPAQEAASGLPQPKVKLLPTFFMPDETGTIQPVTDSTPIIDRLEREYAGRSIRPADPVIGFLDRLIEDYGDEWLTKAMFHYRWVYEADIAKAGATLPTWRGLCIPDEQLAAADKMISERQISRLGFVGSNPVTGPVIEASYRRFLEAFEDHLRKLPYLFGKRPSAADFALYGQLTQLAAFDPTPMALTLKIAPRVHGWTGMLEDLSGLEPTEADWITTETIPDTLVALLTEIGRVYPPVMLANARALMSGADKVEAVVDGQPWTQAPFPYQAKCLKWLREAREALPEAARARVDAVLAPTGCGALFA
jgi:glutathione S-transferase